MNYCNGKGAQKGVLCWEVVPPLKVPPTHISITHNQVGFTVFNQSESIIFTQAIQGGIEIKLYPKSQ